MKSSIAHILSVANFVCSLQGRIDWRGNACRRSIAAAKYIVRVLSMPLRHARYLELIYDNPFMRAYRDRDPRVLERHFHRHVNRMWNRSDRLRSLHRHYRFALACLPTPLFEAIYVQGNATLGSLTLKDGSQLKLGLLPPISKGCEGELCIQLSNAYDEPLYRVVFTVIDNRTTLAIGCLQGPHGHAVKNVVRDLTRNLHGMRPKQLMLSLVYAFARHYRIERIYAISNAAHPLRAAGRKFEADYDAFWREQKGTMIEGGWFLLPAKPCRKSLADVPSHHRSAYRRREALRLDAEQVLTDGLGVPPMCRIAPRAENYPHVGASFQNSRTEALWTG